MSRLSIYRDENLVSEVPLTRASVALGRHPDNDIVLDDRTLSRFHARVERRGDRHFVVDLNAQNGIYLNGSRITGATALAPGDRIVFGKYVAIFDADATSPAKRRRSEGRSVDLDSADGPPTPDRGLKTDLIRPSIALKSNSDERLGVHEIDIVEELPEHTRTEVGARRDDSQDVLGEISESLGVTDDPTTQLLPKGAQRKEPTVVLLFNGVEVSKHPVGNGLVIGRSKGCDVVISLLGLSRRHTRIERRKDGLFVVDLESQNGTWVNNTRVDRERRLAHGDLLNFYEYGVLFLEDPNVALSAAPSTLSPSSDVTRDVLATRETAHRDDRVSSSMESGKSDPRAATVRSPVAHEEDQEVGGEESRPSKLDDDLGLGDGAHFPDDAQFEDVSDIDVAPEPPPKKSGETVVTDDLDASLISSDLDDELIAELDGFTDDPTTASRVPGRASVSAGEATPATRTWVSDEDLEAALVRRADKRVRRIEVYLDDQLYTQVPLTQQVTRIGTDARCELALPRTAGLAAWQLTLITFPAATLLYRASANARVRIGHDDVDHVLLDDGATIVLGRVRLVYHAR